MLPASETLTTAGGAGQEHPREEVVLLPVGESVPGAVRVCAEYGNTLDKARGEIRVQVELRRDGAVVERVSFGGRIRRSASELHKAVYFGCSEPGELESSLRAGDVLVYRLDYRGFPDLGRGDILILIAGVTR